jgi:cytochrome c biogenesis protein CcmG/thiol:disulfide interchange protein DsbE
MKRLPGRASTLGAVRRRLVPILISLAGAALVGLLIYGLGTQGGSRTLDDQVARGDYPLAPQASRMMPVLAGHGLSSLAALRGKVVVLNIWASWCKPCEAEAPLLERAQAALQRHDATILGITYEDASNDSEKFVRGYHLTYPDLRDFDGGFARAYGTIEVPETFVVNRQGRIVAISRGEIEQGFLDRAIRLAETT